MREGYDLRLHRILGIEGTDRMYELTRDTTIGTSPSVGTGSLARDTWPTPGKLGSPGPSAF